MDDYSGIVEIPTGNIDDETGEIRVYPKQVFLRTPYNYDMDAVSDETGLVCEGPSKAQQQFKEECDINTIVERFGLTGELPQNVRVPLLEEFVEVMDYKMALNKLKEADDAFMQFPANIRERFQNDAGKFVDFVADPANVDQCRAWGLATGSSSLPGEATVAPEEKPA